MAPTLYLFHPGRTLVRPIRLTQKSDITWANDFIRKYNEENKTQLIRAILGNNDLVVLKPDDELRLLEEYAEPSGRCR